MIEKLSLLVLALWLLLAAFGPLLPLSPFEIELQSILEKPDWSHPLGYDDLGRSILDRLILGTRLSFIVAISVVAVSAGIGISVGTLAGYSGGWVDLVIVRIIDVFLAFPGLLLAITLAAVLGPGIENVIIALCTVGWVGYARIARAQVLSLKTQDHVLAAVSLGASTPRIIYRHLVPLIMAPLIVEATFGLAGAVVAEAGLSFLGLGVQPPNPSWGSMIRDGARYLLVAPHFVLAPGMALMAVVIAVNLQGDRLRDRLDVRSRDQS